MTDLSFTIEKSINTNDQDLYISTNSTHCVLPLLPPSKF